MRDNLSEMGQIVIDIINQHSELSDMPVEQSSCTLDKERLIAKQAVTQHWEQ